MNALEMFGGIGATAPLGGAESPGVTVVDGGAAGAFEALVVKALESSATGMSPDVQIGDSDTDTEVEVDDTDADNADLSWLLAMTGALTTPVAVAQTADPTPLTATVTSESENTAPQVNAAAAPSAPVGVKPDLDSVPCTPRPAAETGEFVVSQAVSVETGTPSGVSVETATPSAVSSPVVRASVPAPSESPATEVAVAPAAEQAMARPQPSVVEATPAPTAKPAPTTKPAPSQPFEGRAVDVTPRPAVAAVTATIAPTTSPETPAVSASSDQPVATTVDPIKREGARTRSTPIVTDAVRQEAIAALDAALAQPASPAVDATTDSPASQPALGPEIARRIEPVQTHPVAKRAAEPVEAAPFAVQRNAAISAYQAASQQGDSAAGREGGDRQAATAVPAAAATVARVETASRPEFTVPTGSSPAPEAVAPEGARIAAADLSLPAVSAQESAQNVQLLVRAARMQFNTGGGEARLRLDPEHLGPVTLTVRVEQGRVSAHIQAETADASRWIEANQQDLRGALREQGLEVKEVVVTTNPDGRRDREQAPERKLQNRRRRDLARSFEVIV